MKELNDFQRYLTEEFVEDWREGHMSRRDMVRRVVYITGGAASAATVLVSMGCGPAAAPTTAPPQPAASPTSAATVAATAAATKPATSPTSAASPTTAATAGATAAATKPAGATATGAAGTPAAGATGTPGAAGAATKPDAPTAAGPRSPLSVPENDPAVQAMEVEFDGPAGTIHGYLARPTASGTFPGLIVIHENRGLLPHIEDVTRRAAKEGYVALAVDLLSRNGGTDSISDPAQIPGLLGQAQPENLVADLGAGVDYLQAQSQVNADRIGVFGFCFGGGYTWRLAVANQEIDAAVPFYGPAPPLEQVPNTRAAILGIYAGNDQRINASIEPLRAALEQANVTHEIKIYPDVNHAFHNDTGANYNEAAATDAWRTAMAWFDQHLA